jgi:hypothetical protein
MEWEVLPLANMLRSGTGEGRRAGILLDSDYVKSNEPRLFCHSELKVPTEVSCRAFSRPGLVGGCDDEGDPLVI